MQKRRDREIAFSEEERSELTTAIKGVFSRNGGDIRSFNTSVANYQELSLAVKESTGEIIKPRFFKELFYPQKKGTVAIRFKNISILRKYVEGYIPKDTDGQQIDFEISVNIENLGKIEISSKKISITDKLAFERILRNFLNRKLSP